MTVWPHPFMEPTLKTSGAPGTVGVRLLGTFEEEREELVEIVAGKGSVSHYTMEQVNVDYWYQDLGQTSVERTELSTAVAGQSLALMRYKVRFQKFAVTFSRFEKVQFWWVI